MADEIQEMDKELAESWRLMTKYRIFWYIVIAGLLGLGLFLFHPEGYLTNIYTEIISVVFTIVILNVLTEQREDRKRKEELIFQLGSEDNSTSLAAARMLRFKGWLIDGSLKGVNLQGANLVNARLEEANLMYANLTIAYLQGSQLGYAKLQGVRLGNANLIGANLSNANLQGAILHGANLEGAWLFHAKLQGAKLENSVNLQDAILCNANFEGAQMANVRLQGADLVKANFEGARLVGAILPNGEQWTPESDITRFTDPKHPNFWKHPNNWTPIEDLQR